MKKKLLDKIKQDEAVKDDKGEEENAEDLEDMLDDLIWI